MPPPSSPQCELTLIALDGRDAGTRYLVQGTEIPVGRGSTDPHERGAIRLSEPTVSSQQAVIRWTDEGPVIEHCSAATNPTRVNGQAIDRQQLVAGDRIAMGAVVLEVVSSGSAETQVLELEGALLQSPDPGSIATADRASMSWGRLVTLSGAPAGVPRYFVLHGSSVTVGRSPGEDLQIENPSVSRVHVELRYKAGAIELISRSATNPTYVDGVLLAQNQLLKGGEEIQLADRVTLRFEADGALAPHPPDDVEELEELGLVSLVERKLERELELERELQARFGAVGSFLDVDVVDSYGMKTEALRRDHIITSFDRFREFATLVVEENEGQVLNSNGDELMCFFDAALCCVQAASALLERLPEFNRERNLLTRPFRVRLGAHTGESLVDRKRGVAYSPTLDVAGHLQKNAGADELMISEQTMAGLPEGLPLEAAGPMDRHDIQMFRLARFLNASEMGA